MQHKYTGYACRSVHTVGDEDEHDDAWLHKHPVCQVLLSTGLQTPHHSTVYLLTPHIPCALFAADERNQQVHHSGNDEDFDKQVVKLLEDELPQWCTLIGRELVAAIHTTSLCAGDARCCLWYITLQSSSLGRHPMVVP